METERQRLGGIIREWEAEQSKGRSKTGPVRWEQMGVQEAGPTKERYLLPWAAEGSSAQGGAGGWLVLPRSPSNLTYTLEVQSPRSVCVLSFFPILSDTRSNCHSCSHTCLGSLFPSLPETDFQGSGGMAKMKTTE